MIKKQKIIILFSVVGLISTVLLYPSDNSYLKQRLDNSIELKKSNALKILELAESMKNNSTESNETKMEYQKLLELDATLSHNIAIQKQQLERWHYEP